MARLMEVLGKSFWLPDPDSVSHLAGTFGAIRDNLGETDSQLQALRSPGSWADWTGPAADAFARCLGQLPGQLGQAHESYATVAAALSSYAAGLYPVVNALLSLGTEAEEAESTLRTATAELDYARNTGNHASVTYWEPRVRAASETVDGLTSRLAYLLGELDGLSARCVQQIRQAQHEGIQNNLITDFDRYVLMDGGTAAHDAHKAMDIAGGVLDGIFVKPFSDLPGDLDKLWHQRDLHALGKVLDDVAGILGAIGLVALVVAAVLPGTDAVGVPALIAYLGVTAEDAEAVGAVGEAALDAEESVGEVALVANSLALATDEPGATPADVGIDLLNVETGDIGDDLDLTGWGEIGYDSGTAVGSDLLQNGVPQSASIPAMSYDGPDITGGLDGFSSGLQGLQAGAPDGTALQPGSGSGVLQPAGGIPATPAALTVQHVSVGTSGQSEVELGVGM